jgi:hypothetical protein
MQDKCPMTDCSLNVKEYCNKQIVPYTEECELNKNLKIIQYSLINVTKEKNNSISGYWIQDHTGTIETVKDLANRTLLANNNRIKIAIIKQVPNTTPLLDYFHDLKPIIVINKETIENDNSSK